MNIKLKNSDLGPADAICGIHSVDPWLSSLFNMEQRSLTIIFLFVRVLKFNASFLEVPLTLGYSWG